MNAIARDYLPLFQEYQALRSQLMDLLTDADLGHRLGGETLSLGELCREMGEVQHAYVESFKSMALDFAYRHPNPAVAGSVAALKAWYAALDQELERLITAFSDEDLSGRVIERGPHFRVPIQTQLDIYKEALLIFYGKVSVYLRSMGRPRPPQWEDWIA